MGMPMPETESATQVDPTMKRRCKWRYNIDWLRQEYEWCLQDMMRWHEEWGKAGCWRIVWKHDTRGEHLTLLALQLKEIWDPVIEPILEWCKRHLTRAEQAYEENKSDNDERGRRERLETRCDVIWTNKRWVGGRWESRWERWLR